MSDSLNVALAWANGVSALFASVMMLYAALRGSHWLTTPRTAGSFTLFAFSCGYVLRATQVLSVEASSVYLRGTAVAVCLCVAWAAIEDVRYEGRMSKRADELMDAVHEEKQGRE